MKIIFFDVQNWEKEILAKHFPEAVLAAESLSETTVEKYADAEVVSTFIASKISETVLSKLPNLRFITTRSTGYDHINLEECQKRGVTVSNVPEYGSNTVAEHTFALLLALTRKVHASIHQAQVMNFDHEQLTGVDLYDKTIGIIGMGKIGQHVARIAYGFGMKVTTTSRNPDQKLADDLHFTYVTPDQLLSESDVLTLHLPLTPQTHHFINTENVTKIKKGCFLINTARGGLVQTEAVVKGLNDDIFSGVGLDVLEEEQELSEEVAILSGEYKKSVDYKTLLLDHVLMNHPKVVFTPHNAFNSKEALMRITYTTLENIDHYISNSPQNIVKS